MKIPRKLLVKDQIYEVKYVSRIPSVNDGTKGPLRGLCCSDKQVIYIARGISKAEKVQTFFHELLHAIEFEYDIEIDHKLVYKLEGPLAQVIVDNLAS